MRSALGSQPKVAAVEEFTRGMFNAVYGVALEGAPPVVLKVAPPPDDSILLTYEADIMRTEVDFTSACAARRPARCRRCWPSTLSRKLIPSDFFFMEMLNGVPLNRAKKRLSREEFRRIKGGLGGIIGRLGRIRGSGFGYPQPGAKARAPRGAKPS